MEQQIIYLSNKQIDKAKWDKCIAEASNGLIYGYSFYLDAMSKHWDALVMNDYEVVMPLTWNRKYGIYYLYQPAFTASLGVFGNNLSAEIVKRFLMNIPEKFKYWDIYLNHGNLFSIPEFKWYERCTYLLNLNRPYEKIIAGYSQNHLRNIKKALQAGCTIEKNIHLKEVITLAAKQSKNYSSVTNEDYKNFKKLYKHLQQTKQNVTYGVFDAEKKLVSACVFFFSVNRAYYILAANTPDSKKLGSSHFLINAFIQDHANENMLLDFEGSQIKSLANFYQRFGAEEEKYPAIKINRLPFVLQLFKK